MGYKSKIAWTQSTWNCFTGCNKVSAGCKHCYAETLTERFRGTPGHYFENGFDLTFRPDKLDLPRRWKQPKMIFVNSLSDLFHKDIPFEQLQQVFQVMNQCPQHVFQVLTKRHENLLELAPKLTWTPNIWMGVSVEDAENAKRIDYLRQVPAAVRFISMEPLIGPIIVDKPLNLDGIAWVIVGGESGSGARPMNAAWALKIIHECQRQKIPVFMKQTGSVLAKEWGLDDRKGGEITEWPKEFQIREMPGGQ